ncbi:phage terminase large subunit family protein [Cupriavidus basilensis]
MNMRDGYQAVLEAVRRAWVLPETLTVSEWADKHRVMPTKGAAEPGPWRTDRTPYLREVMDTLSDHHPATDVCFMAASQVGKTEVLLNWIGYIVDHAPAPTLVVQPTIDTAEKYSKQRIAPMIELSPPLREKIPPSRSRDSGNTTLVKDFPGGLLVMTGSNAASSLASMPIKDLALDETDRYPSDVDEEGDPIALAEQRTITFPRAKRYKASTPGRESTSHIGKEYERSSQAEYYVPCPHCQTMQVLVFEQLRWLKREADGRREHLPETTGYVCPDCASVIEERHKTWMLANGEWRHKYPDRKRLGYHINALYSPIGLGRSWVEIAEAWLVACRDRAKMQPFVNLIKGLPYEDHSDRMRGSDIKNRAEGWALRTIPVGLMVLTLGVDVQKDRLALHLVAWGEGERCATIDYVELPGSPERDEVWLALTEYRRRPVRNIFGVDMQIAMTAIDTGGHSTHRVYNYARLHRHDRVIAVKGSSMAKRPVLSKPTQQDVKNDKGVVHRKGVALWMVGTDTAKAALFARLDGDGEVDVLPADRMVRYPTGLPDDFYEGLTAEVYDEAKGKWVKIRARNEPLDTWVYAYAAACHPNVRINRLQSADWAHLSGLIQPRMTDLFATPQALEDRVGDSTAVVPLTSEALALPAAESPPPDAGVAHDDNWLGDTDGWLGD